MAERENSNAEDHILYVDDKDSAPFLDDEVVREVKLVHTKDPSLTFRLFKDGTMEIYPGTYDDTINLPSTKALEDILKALDPTVSITHSSTERERTSSGPQIIDSV